MEEKNENQQNFIKKLTNYLKYPLMRVKESFKDPKIKKRLAALALSCSILVAPLSACSKINRPITNSGTSIENSIDYPYNSSIDISQSSGSKTSSSTPTSAGQSSQIDIKQYSPLLQSVLTSNEYNTVISQLEQSSGKRTSNYYLGMPYGFLEQQGFDIDKLKSNTLKRSARSFILNEEPDVLYIATYAQKTDEDDYYYEYLLKYKLTKQEIEDYHMIHSGRYSHSEFINDAISRQKDPIILCENKMSITAHKNLAASLGSLSNTKTFLGVSTVDLILKDFDEDTQEFDVYVYPYFSGDLLVKESKVGIYPLLTRISDYNDIFYAPIDNYGSYYLQSSFDINSSKPATVYYIPETGFTTRTNFLSEKNKGI